jgi:hypothetical protein
MNLDPKLDLYQTQRRTELEARAQRERLAAEARGARPRLQVTRLLGQQLARWGEQLQAGDAAATGALRPRKS